MFAAYNIQREIDISANMLRQINISLSIYTIHTKRNGISVILTKSVHNLFVITKKQYKANWRLK